MEYRTLGGSGSTVSMLTLGTMTFGGETNEECARAQLDHLVEAGGSLDTADVYTGGVSEEIIGRRLGKQSATVRDQVALATKDRFPMGCGPNDAGLSRHLAGALDASLARLGVDRVDLYQAHAYDPWMPLEETLTFSTMPCTPGRSTTLGCRTSPAGSYSAPPTSVACRRR